MKKLKKLLVNNGSLTLLSIISLILVFAIVCLAVLSVIYKTGFTAIPFVSRTAESTQSALPPSADGDNREPEYEAINSEETIKKLLASFPYYDDFYAEFYVTYIYESYNVEFYRIYKQGERYRIEIYDMQHNLSELIVCDGMGVAVRNKEGFVKSYPVSEEFTLANQTPLPSFLFYKSEVYTLSEYIEEDGVCTIECEYPVLGTKDIVTIDMETGIMKSSLMYLGEKVIMFYDMMEFETDFTFDDSLFIFT